MNGTDNASNPLHHVDKIQGMLDMLINHVREDVGKVDEPRAKVLFETTAEVLLGLKTAYQHYQEAREPAVQH